METLNKKSLFRNYVLKKSNKKQINNFKKDKVLIKELFNFIKEQKAKNIMIYIPLKREVNIMPLIKELRQKGYNLYSPFMEGKSFRLVKYRLPLEVKKFKIKEAKVSNFKISTIDLAIVPIVGIDKSCKRIGFGKGMYDRFFEKNKKIIKTTIFLERELYICTDIITDYYDISADFLFTTKCKLVKI
jgi:5-formyltetrahydrofolate cyclo-ligase